MKILIYGGGAVGLGISSCLTKANVDVTILARPSAVSALKKYGLIRKGIFGKAHHPPQNFQATSALKDIKKSVFNFILVTTKSFDSKHAAKELSCHKKILDKSTKIILCQNGWGNADHFLKYFSRDQIFNARIITGFTRPQEHIVDVTVHAESIRIGSLYQKEPSGIEQLAKKISEGGIPCRSSGSIEKDLWTKMLYNCALNPLGAIFDVPYGILGEFLDTKSLMEAIISEVFAVMKASGYRSHFRTPKDYCRAFYKKLLPATYQHRSSMLQDLKAGKKTEVDAINGMVLHLAQKNKVPAPINEQIYMMVKLTEQRNKSIKE